MTSSHYLAAPKPAPDLHIPPSSSVVMVSVIDPLSRLSLPMATFLAPLIKGIEVLAGAPSYATLIEHPSGRKVLFDLGIRKDTENLAPGVLGIAKQFGWTMQNGKNVSEVLSENGISPKEIESVIWSHHHFDHVGDITTFPSTTSIIVGPGFKACDLLPGYPANPESGILESDYEGHIMREISFEGSFNIGGFAAHDFFGDGSFYLLSTPGHTIGHMSALARTTASTFVFLGGDCCHYAGAYRPSPYLPLPSSFKPSPFTPNDSHSFCPGSAFQAAHPKHSATEPFLDLCGPVPHDIEAARVSIRGMEAFDASDDVLVIIAHDATLLGVMDLYPKSLNGWKESSTKPASRWRFLGDLKDAVDGNANMEGL